MIRKMKLAVAEGCVVVMLVCGCGEKNSGIGVESTQISEQQTATIFDGTTYGAEIMSSNEAQKEETSKKESISESGEKETITETNEEETPTEENKEQNMLVKQITYYYDIDNQQNKGIMSYEYDKNGNLTNEATYILKDGQLDYVSYEEMEYEYNSENQKVKEIEYEYGYVGEEKRIEKKIECLRTWEYYDNGVLQEEICIHYDDYTDGMTGVSLKAVEEYDCKGSIINRIEETREESATTIYEYDERGYLLQERYSVQSKESIRDNYEIITIYKYNDNGQLLSRKSIKKYSGEQEGTVDNFYECEYDATGFMVKEIFSEWRYTQYEKDSDGNIIEYRYEKEKDEYVCTSITGHKYDKDGKVLADIRQTGGDGSTVWEYSYFYEYDKNGQLLKRYIAERNEKGAVKSEYIRDENGKILQYNVYSGNGSKWDEFVAKGSYIYEYYE